MNNALYGKIRKSFKNLITENLLKTYGTKMNVVKARNGNIRKIKTLLINIMKSTETVCIFKFNSQQCLYVVKIFIQ